MCFACTRSMGLWEWRAVFFFGSNNMSVIFSPAWFLVDGHWEDKGRSSLAFRARYLGSARRVAMSR